MYAIFTRKDRIIPVDAVPTDEEGVQLLGTMVAYAGTFTLGPQKVMHHIDISWNQAWIGTDQVRFYKLDPDVLSITTAPYKSYYDGKEGRSPALFAKHPGWHGQIDTDPVLAEVTRRRLFDRAVSDKALVPATTSRFPPLVRSCRTAQVIPSCLLHN